MRETDAVRLADLLEYARDALAFASGRTRADLDSDRMLIFVLTRAVEIGGEAATRLSPELRARHPEIPWQNSRGMRNRLVHTYHDLNLNIVWHTVTKSCLCLSANWSGYVTPRAGDERQPLKGI